MELQQGPVDSLNSDKELTHHSDYSLQWAEPPSQTRRGALQPATKRPVRRETERSPCPDRSPGSKFWIKRSIPKHLPSWYAYCYLGP